MEIAVVTEGIKPGRFQLQPWFRYSDRLEADGITLQTFEASDPAAFRQPFDAMMLYAWQDWKNRLRFDPYRILPVMEKMAAYRAEFPQTVQIRLRPWANLRTRSVSQNPRRRS